MATPPRRSFLISSAWIQAVAIVIILGFFVLGLLAYRTYTDKPPIPVQVTGPDGRVLFPALTLRTGRPCSCATA
jgi:nitric oxide reductase subunit B